MRRMIQWKVTLGSPLTMLWSRTRQWYVTKPGTSQCSMPWSTAMQFTTLPHFWGPNQGNWMQNRCSSRDPNNQTDVETNSESSASFHMETKHLELRFPSDISRRTQTNRSLNVENMTEVNKTVLAVPTEPTQNLTTSHIITVQVQVHAAQDHKHFQDNPNVSNCSSLPTISID